MAEAAETKILSHLSTSDNAEISDTFPWSEAEKLDHAVVVGTIKSLLVDEYIKVENLSESFYSLTKEGEAILSNGSQEYNVLQALEETGALSLPELEAKVGKGIAKIGMGNCMKKKWIKKDGGNLVPLKKAGEVADEVQAMLKKLQEADFAKGGISDKVRPKIYRAESSAIWDLWADIYFICRTQKTLNVEKLPI
jgi:phenylalanyl-tRNA synthetase alpha chain